MVLNPNRERYSYAEALEMDGIDATVLFDAVLMYKRLTARDERCKAVDWNKKRDEFELVQAALLKGGRAAFCDEAPKPGEYRASRYTFYLQDPLCLDWRKLLQMIGNKEKVIISPEAFWEITNAEYPERFLKHQLRACWFSREDLEAFLSPPVVKKGPDPRKEKTDMRIIAGLLDWVKELKTGPAGAPTEDAIMDELIERCPGAFSKRTLLDRFPQAKRELNSLT